MMRVELGNWNHLERRGKCGEVGVSLDDVQEVVKGIEGRDYGCAEDAIEVVF